MTQRKAEILLAVVIASRATSFVFNKIGLATMHPFNMLAVRFLLGFVLLAAIFHKRLLPHLNCRTVLFGALVGLNFFAIMSCEMFALQTAASGTVSLLENLAIIFVPLAEALLHRRAPKGMSVLCAGIAVAGVFLLTMRGGQFALGRGEGIALISAMLYTRGIINIDRTSHRCDAFTIGVLEVGFLGFYALIASCIFETPRLPNTGAEWSIILALAVVCTGFGYTFQPVAQSHTTAERSSLFCALSPAVATVLGAIVLREAFTPLNLLGIVLILGGILLPHFVKEKKAMKYKTFLFDMDGTTMNTLDDLHDAVNRTLRLHGYPERTPAQIRDATGNGAKDLIAQSLPQGVDTPDFDAVLQDYRAWYEAHSCVKTAPYPGTVETLRELQRRGAAVAIISNKNDPAVQALGEKFFPGIPVLGEVPPLPRKPAPDMVDAMLQKLGASRDDAVYIGDSEVDIATARNCRMDFIGVSWGFRGREKLLEIAPKATVVDTWEEFLQIVD